MAACVAACMAACMRHHPCLPPGWAHGTDPRSSIRRTPAVAHAALQGQQHVRQENLLLCPQAERELAWSCSARTAPNHAPGIGMLRLAAYACALAGNLARCCMLLVHGLCWGRHRATRAGPPLPSDRPCAMQAIGGKRLAPTTRSRCALMRRSSGPCRAPRTISRYCPPAPRRP